MSGVAVTANGTPEEVRQLELGRKLFLCACLAEYRLFCNLCTASCMYLCVHDCVHVCVSGHVVITDQPLMVILFCETCWVTWYPALPTDWFGPVSTLAKPFNPVGRVSIVTHWPVLSSVLWSQAGWGNSTPHLLPWFKYHCWNPLNPPNCSSVAALWPTDPTGCAGKLPGVNVCKKKEKERKYCCYWNLSGYECGMSCRSTCDRGVFTTHGYL